MEQMNKLLDTVLESIMKQNESHKEINKVLRELVMRLVELEERVNMLDGKEHICEQ